MIRTQSFERVTAETSIKGSLTIEGNGKSDLNTGIGFLDHMLDLFAFHSGFDLNLVCKGDLEVCPHHSVEDIALTLGEAFVLALAEKKGLKRYACVYLPMDETLSRTVLDISGRPFHLFKGGFESANIGALPTEMIKHFFYSFSMTSRLTLHQEIIYGENDHHKAESLFKGFGRALSESATICSDKLPSSKGVL
jgi:imidazoleglycerol-phosphate dehydratase